MAAAKNTKAEFKRLKTIVPSIKRKDHVSKLDIILEAIKYIDDLQDQLFDRLGDDENDLGTNATSEVMTSCPPASALLAFSKEVARRSSEDERLLGLMACGDLSGDLESDLEDMEDMEEAEDEGIDDCCQSSSSCADSSTTSTRDLTEDEEDLDDLKKSDKVTAEVEEEEVTRSSK